MSIAAERLPGRIEAAVARPMVAALALAAFAVALYAPTLDHELVMDDPVYIARNPAVVTGAAFSAYFLDRRTTASDPDLQWQSWRPLRTLSFRLLARIAGVRPIVFSAANLLLYVASVLLVRALAQRAGAGAAGATVAAALWAAAPVHVEPVLYASALGDHLSLVFELGAVICALRATGGERLRFLPVFAAVVLTSLAMLAKEMAVTAPALVALAAWSTGALRARPRHTLVVLALLVAVVGAFFLARTAVLQAVGHAAITPRGVLAGAAHFPMRVAAYAWITLAPLGHSPAHALAPPSAPLVVASWLGVVAAALVLRRASPPGRLAVAWFVVALLPVAGLVPIFAELADRFALLPSVGLALGVAPTATALARRWRPLGPLAPLCLLVLYVAGTLVEAPAWANDDALWAKAVALEPRSAQAHRNLGIVYLERRRPDLALAHLDRARSLGDGADQIEYWRALALEALGRRGEAAAAAAAAVARRPASGSIRALHGLLLAQEGALDSADQALVLARRLDPDHPSVLLLGAELAAARGDHAREIAGMDTLVERYPEDPRFSYRRAVALAAAGDGRAADAARACLRLAPGHPPCLCLLGRARAQAGSIDEARRALDAGLSRMPPGPERIACEQRRLEIESGR